MAGQVLVTVTLPYDTGRPEDIVTNTFTFFTDGAFTAADTMELMDQVEKFYTTIAIGNAVKDYMSGLLNNTAGACTMKAFDITGHLDGSPVGSPLNTKLWTLPSQVSGTATPLPTEVALAMTLEATGRSGQAVSVPGGEPGPVGDVHPKARFTGRVFLGPFNTLANVSGSPPAAMIADINARASSLKADALVQAPAWKWGVWSRKDAVVREVDFVSIDNAFDTIRSRGLRAGTRTRQDV